MAEKRGDYTAEDLEAALMRVSAGEKFAAVARTSSIPLRTLFKKTKDIREGRTLEGNRRGTKPAIPHEIEADLVEWVAAMQRVGLPVGRPAIIKTANKIYTKLKAPPTRSTPIEPLTSGWYARFMRRHPALSARMAQPIARVRNSVNQSSVHTLFYTMVKLVVEKRLDASRVYNMDETSFMPKASSRRIVAVKGSTNVWSQETRPNFHMTVVAAVNAAGTAVPPLIVVPGVRLYREDIAAISIEDATVSGAPKGFSNAGLFKLWVAFFSEQLLKHKIELPVILVLDNSSTHINIESVTLCVELGILLVALPPNGTHLFQPLDVAVFKPFKAIVRERLQDRLFETADTLLPKRDAISIACEAYQAAIIDRPQNAVNGLSGTGLFPVSLVQLLKRLDVYASGGAKGELGTAEWLQRKDAIQDEIRSEVLTLPPESAERGRKKRKTVDVSGRLVSKEMLLGEQLEM